MSEPEATDRPSNTQQSPQFGSASPASTREPEPEVKQIGPNEPSPTFRPVYTGFDEDIEVELIDHVPASQSNHRFGHALIDHPEWDQPKRALLQNVRVDVLNDGTEESLGGQANE